MYPHKGLIQFTYANLIQIKCLNYPYVNKSLQSRIFQRIWEFGLWITRHQCVHVYTSLAPKLVSLSDVVVCDKIAICGRNESSLLEDNPVSP